MLGHSRVAKTSVRTRGVPRGSFGTNPLKPNFLNICSEPVTTYNKDKAM